MFEAFARMLPADWNVNEETAEGRALSGPLPMGGSRRPPAVAGMLLVGDAAGMVNPFNGEGIAYAMENGELAAELIHEALVKDRPGVAQLYPTILRERYETLLPDRDELRPRDRPSERDARRSPSTACRGRG